MAEIRLARRAVEDLDRLPDRAAARILDALERLASDPSAPHLDVKILVGKRPWRRLREGSYRVLFKVTDRGGTVLVARVIDRRDLERAVRLLP